MVYLITELDDFNRPGEHRGFSSIRDATDWIAKRAREDYHEAATYVVRLSKDNKQIIVYDDDAELEIESYAIQILDMY